MLYRTPVKSTTWLLWFGPFLLLIAGIAGLLFYLGRRRARTVPSELTVEQHTRAQALLSAADGDGAAPSSNR